MGLSGLAICLRGLLGSFSSLQDAYVYADNRSV